MNLIRRFLPPRRTGPRRTPAPDYPPSSPPLPPLILWGTLFLSKSHFEVYSKTRCRPPGPPLGDWMPSVPSRSWGACWLDLSLDLFFRRMPVGGEGRRGWTGSWFSSGRFERHENRRLMVGFGWVFGWTRWGCPAASRRLKKHPWYRLPIKENVRH